MRRATFDSTPPWSDGQRTSSAPPPSSTARPTRARAPLDFQTRDARIGSIFRILCLVTAVANAGGNAVLLLYYRPIFALLGVPPPADLPSFVFVSGFSFTMGLLAYLIYRSPAASTDLLVVGIAGKAIYALSTFYFFTEGNLHWFYLIFGAWDAVYAVIFALFLIHLVSPDLKVLNAGAILPGAPRLPTRKALLLCYSLTGNGRGAMAKVREGLAQSGYSVDQRDVVADDPLYHFPFSFGDFLQILVRAVLRRPTRARPLGLRPDHDYDLIVVECPTWFVGIAAPMEAIFQDPANRAAFAGRDVAAVNVCRGLWRRSQAMLVRRLEASGGNVVGARAFTNPGREPARVLSLFLFLAFGEPGRPRFLRRWLTPQTLGPGPLSELERFGRDLAARPRTPLPIDSAALAHALDAVSEVHR